MSDALIPAKKVRALILTTNLVYIASLVLKMRISNPAYFFENAFRTTNLLFYGYVLLSWLLIRSNKLYFLSSFLLILDLPVNLKQQIQNFLLVHLHLSVWLYHGLLLLLLALFIFFVYRYKVMGYFQVFLLFFYLASLLIIVFQTKTTRATTLYLGQPVSSISKNYYFLLFDEYPGEKVISEYGLCEKPDYPSSFLPKQGFTGDQNSYSNYLSTVRSTINFLTGSLQSGYNVNDAIDAIDSNVFTRRANYSFTAFSVLDKYNRPNSLFERYYFYNFNNLLTRQLIPWCISRFSRRGAGDYTDGDVYNGDALAKLGELLKGRQPHIAYIHFFTPHIYPLVRGEPSAQRIHNANEWMLKAINAVTKNDPKAGVIIFSDHGWRAISIPAIQRNLNLLYYRNVVIDTSLVNKNGLVDLTKSIKY
ncbi:MAG TPA: hypothetical protein VG367_03370 [Mucilaginibacter sp.]|jgi:hypothetical protein|nr:hypothetical protein [Mucilaginibacter sp.]